MKVIKKIKEKFNATKEWIVEHKELLITDAAIFGCCAGAISVAVVVSKNEDKKAAKAQQAIIEDEPILEEEQIVIDIPNDAEEQSFNNDEPVEETINEEVEA